MSDDALLQVGKALSSLKQNERFHGVLQQPSVAKAVRHWAGIDRLAPEECEDWQSDPQIMFVLAELRRLEHYCRQAGMKVPLHTVLACEDELALPDGRRLRSGELVEPAVQTTEEDLPDLPPVDPRSWRRTLVWQLITMVLAAILARIGVWYQEEEFAKMLNATSAEL
ncbi:ALKBH3 [Symbiodinium natans]|uniref:ALKBH3 protein n=1 Tax=Symbiodinium natans TaxID=878477 RepID=A0A812VFF6_9DINO|nr:ALKBH3 [Symbiodinium natans]